MHRFIVDDPTWLEKLKGRLEGLTPAHLLSLGVPERYTHKEDYQECTIESKWLYSLPFGAKELMIDHLVEIELTKKPNITVKCMAFNALLESIHSREKTVYPDCLLVYNFGLSSLRDWEAGNLATFLMNRYDNDLITILATEGMQWSTVLKNVTVPLYDIVKHIVTCVKM